jgi:hypothetical protein
MSRTYRNVDRNGYYRRFKTLNEKKQIEAIQNDPELKDYKLGKINRLNRFIPNAWDDIPIAALNESDYDLE